VTVDDMFGGRVDVPLLQRVDVVTDGQRPTVVRRLGHLDHMPGVLDDQPVVFIEARARCALTVVVMATGDCPSGSAQAVHAGSSSPQCVGPIADAGLCDHVGGCAPNAVVADEAAAAVARTTRRKPVRNVLVVTLGAS
jgi:hypothetical protein